MKKFTKLFGGIFAIALLLFSNPSMASHFKGGDVYFVCTGNGYYKLVFACYYACEPTSSSPYDAASESFTITSSCPTVPTTLTCTSETPQQDVPLYCPGVLTSCDYGYPYSNAPANAPSGTLVVVYQTDSFQIPPGCTVTAEISNGNRNGAITNLQNPSGTYLDIAATITAPLNGGCNNNPQFAQYPVNVFCLGQNANFSQGAIDASGDSLVYTLINPRDIGGTPIPFVAGCTPSDPLGVNGGTGFASVFNFNSSTGNINFTPTASGNYVLTVQVDAYHNGVLVGSVMRDIQFTVTPCNDPPPPVLTSLFSQANITGGVVIDSNHVGVCPGEHLQIDLIATTTDSFSYLLDTTNVAQSLPGSVISVTHAGTRFDSITLHISWTPGNSDSGFHYIIVTVKDTVCPRPGSNTYAFVVSVLGGLYAGPNLVYCAGGDPVTIYASGANHYLWTDSATGGPPVGVQRYGPDSSYIVVAPPNGAGYVVQGDLLGSCKNRDTVSVKTAHLFSLHTTAQDTSVCKYTTTQLTTVPSPGTYAPFTYVWAPAANVVSPNSATTSTAPILNTGYYYVTATSSEGCAIHDSVKIIVSGAAPRVSILPNTNYVCPGDTVTLNSNVLTESLVQCGLVDTLPSNPAYFSGSVSNDTSSSTGSFGFTNFYGSPFMGSINSFRIQYLFTQAELNAAGLSSGTFTDMSFFIKTLNSTAAYDTFTVSMGCTSQNSLNGFVNNLQEVIPAGTITPQANVNLYANSWNPLPFTHYFNWDGSSNIVIQICYTFDQNIVSNDDFVSYSTTPYAGSCVYAGDIFGQNGCTLGPGSFYYGVINTRPNIKFDIVAPNVLTYQWSPATLICDTCPSTQFIVTHDTTVTLTVSDGTCTNDSSKRLLINPAIEITAERDTVLCSGSNSVQLNVVLDNPSNPSCIQGYDVASIPYAPIAVSGIPTLIPPTSFVDASGFTDETDNGTAGPNAIGFNFPFYCQSYNQFYVNSNGWMSFVNPYPATQFFQEYTAQTYPPSAADLNPQKVIALMVGDYYLADLFGGGGGSVDYFVSGGAPNRILVVQFNSMADVNGLYTTTGEIHLYENTGVIEVLIQSSDYAGTNHTTGVKDSTGLGTAAPGRNNQQYTVSTPEAWRFTPQFGASVAVGSTVWTPNLYLNNNTIPNPVATPPNTPETYVVTTTLILNPSTSHPTNCVVTDSVHIGFGHTAGGSSHAVPAAVCVGGSAQLNYTTADTITSYHWTPGAGLSDSTIATPTAASVMDTTVYYVRVVNSEGCVTWATDTISTYPPIVVTLPAGASVCDCHPDMVITPTIVGGTPAFNYVWSNGGTDATTLDTVLNGSSYMLTVTDANGCTAISNKDSFTMNCPLVNITVAPVSDTIFLHTDTATLTAASATGSAFTYQWWADSASVLSPNTAVTGLISNTAGTDTIHLIVMDTISGCMDTTATVIHVVSFGAFVMPTAFTPNGDSKNPYFHPVVNGPNSPVTFSAFRIYSRWGQLVYDKADGPGWDGNFNGIAQPAETYMYFVTGVYPDPNDPAKTVSKSVEGIFQLQR